MSTLEEIEKLVTLDVLRKVAQDVGWLRRGTVDCQCLLCGAKLEFVLEGERARWHCLGKKPHGGGSLELIMIGRGRTEVEARRLMAFAVGLENWPAGVSLQNPETPPARRRRSPPPEPERPAAPASKPSRSVRAPTRPAPEPPSDGGSAPSGDLDELISAIRDLVNAFAGRTAPQTQPEPLWGAAELGAFLKVSPKAVYAMAERRHVPAVRIGRLLRFEPAVIRRWVRRQADRR